MSLDLVLFGGTGDLTWNKLMPALFRAFRRGSLPPRARLLAVALDEFSDTQYRAVVLERLSKAEATERPNDGEFAGFAQLLHYRRMDLSQPGGYADLRRWIDEPRADEGRVSARAKTVVLYLATSPHLFPVICKQLGAAGINAAHVRVVLEKPLGHDIHSAQKINRVVRSVFKDEQVFRIDHYLGKPAVQGLKARRFGQVSLETLWQSRRIAHIQITLAESLGVGTRGEFYDKAGALRDMIQNHALQLLTLIAMAPPSSNDADAIHDKKLEVLKSLMPFTAQSVARDVVRGQYRAGHVDGQAVPGYLGEDHVQPLSPCETFVALRTEVQNPRWAGVPFYLRTGKRLAARAARIVVTFRQVPRPNFPGAGQRNKRDIKPQPEDAIELHLPADVGGGSSEGLSSMSLDLDFDQALPDERVTDYECLLLEVIAGRQELFVRSDEQEQAWRWIEPVLEAWRHDPTGPLPYEAGSWGPAAASALVARDGFVWAQEQ